MLKCESLFSDQCFRDLAIQFHLECMYTSLFYWEYQQAREHVEKAKELTGLEFSTTGRPEPGLGVMDSNYEAPEFVCAFELIK